MDIDKMIAEVERLDRCATRDWRQEGCKIKCGPNGSMLTKDAYGSPMFIAYDDASAAVYCRNAAPLLAAEVRRLRAGGCARDQRTTQFCAEAVAKDVEIAKLRDQILAYQQELHIAEQEIARLKGTMIEPTEQTGDEDSEQ